jgi:hypothetical protein
VMSAACLLTLSGCSAKEPLIRTETVTRTVEVRITVPAELTEPLPAPAIPDGELSWPDIAGLGIQYREVWLYCEAQKAQIRALEDQ